MTKANRNKNDSNPNGPGDMGFLRRRWKTLVASIFGILFLLVAFAPTLLVQTGWLKKLVNQYSGLKAQIDFDSASLGWFSKVTLKDVSLTLDDETVCTAKELTLSTTVMDLVFSGIDEAEIDIQGAELNVVHHDSTLNLLELTKESDESESSPLPNLTIKIAESKIHVFESAVQQGALENVEAVVELGGEPSEQLVKIDLAATVNSDGQAGQLNTEVTVKLDGEYGFVSTETRTEAQNVPVRFANPIFCWLEIPEFTATLNGKGNVDIGYAENGITVDSTFRELNIASTDPATNSILKDHVAIPVTLDGQLLWNKIDSTRPTHLDLNCNYGDLEVHGQIPPSHQLTLENLFEQNLRIEGNFDLARFASDFPNVIQVKENLTIEHGEISFNGFCRNEGNERRILLDARADRISAISGRDKLNWDKPVSLSIAFAKNNDTEKSKIEFFEIKSEFLTGTGSGDFENGNVKLAGDLGLLYQRLTQFFQLGEFQIAGDLNGGFDWNTKTQDASSNQLRLFGKTNIRDFVFGFDANNRWDEHSLSISFDMVSQFSDHVLTGIEKLESLMAIDNDSLQIVQRKPVELTADYQFIFDADLTGSSRKWSQRLNSLFDMGVLLNGNAKISAVVSSTPTTFRVRTKQFVATPFELAAGGISIAEPGMQAKLDVVYNKSQGDLTFNNLLIESPNVRVETKPPFEINLQSMEPFQKATVSVSANAYQISKWFLPESVLARGLVSGEISLESSKESFELKSNLQSYDFELLQVSKDPVTNQLVASELIKKGKSELICSAGFSATGDAIDFRQLTWRSLGSRLDLNGQLQMKENLYADLSGTLETDMRDLCEQLRPYIGDQVKLVGQSKNAVSLKGPLTGGSEIDIASLFPKKLNGSAEVKWESGELFSLPLSRGSVKGELKNSEIQVLPSSVKLGNADLVAKPVIKLRSDPYSIVVPEGWVIQNADIGPDVFRNWMRYVTPLLADATEARGKFSVALDQSLEMPFSNPLDGKIAGRMQVDSVTVGPGKLGQSLISMTRQVLAIFGKGEKLGSLASRPWLELPRQEIRISVDGGKVTHQQLRIQVGEVAIYTTGSVDMNQNIDMLVQIPVEADWFSENPILKSVVGNSIQIPLKGNVSNPKFNLDLLSRLTKRMTSGALDSLIEKGTKGLLDGKILDGKLLEGGDKKDLGKFFEGKAKDLLRDRLLKGLQGSDKK